MCILSRHGELSETRILIDVRSNGQIGLFYQMSYEGTPENTMVLPIPSKNLVEFIDTQDNTAFLKEINEGFPRVVTLGAPTRGSRLRLPVVRVGRFIATHVPTKSDIDRLDPEFQIPAEVFDEYDDSWSYVAFKFAEPLTEDQVRDGAPQALAYVFGVVYMNEGRIVFPTKHYHGNGRVRSREVFDHLLFLHTATPPAKWTKSERAIIFSKPVPFIEFAPDKCFYKIMIKGMYENVDIAV